MDTTENSDLAKQNIINFPFLSDLPSLMFTKPMDCEPMDDEVLEKDDNSMNSETSSKNLTLKLTETVVTETLLNPVTLSNPPTLSTPKSFSAHVSLSNPQKHDNSLQTSIDRTPKKRSAFTSAEKIKHVDQYLKLKAYQPCLTQVAYCRERQIRERTFRMWVKNYHVLLKHKHDNRRKLRTIWRKTKDSTGDQLAAMEVQEINQDQSSSFTKPETEETENIRSSSKLEVKPVSQKLHSKLFRTASKLRTMESKLPQIPPKLKQLMPKLDEYVRAPKFTEIIPKTEKSSILPSSTSCSSTSNIVRPQPLYPDYTDYNLLQNNSEIVSVRITKDLARLFLWAFLTESKKQQINTVYKPVENLSMQSFFSGSIDKKK